jgi:hypothetical protein
MSVREKVIAIRTTRRDATLAEIGAEAGVSRERVRQILVSAGLRTRSFGRPRVKPPKPVIPRWGRNISTHANGRIGELYVALDLLRRGYDVFASVAWTQSCDLVAVSRKSYKALRLEVKGATRTPTGKSAFCKPRDPSRYEHLAIVFPTGEVEYRPELPIEDDGEKA